MGWVTPNRTSLSAEPARAGLLARGVSKPRAADLMAKNSWSTPLPRPITIPQVMTLKTLADVRKLLGHIPRERRELSTWKHVEKTLHECAAGDDPANISVALQIVLQGERVPYRAG
jgi:hypothetical protein